MEAVSLSSQRLGNKNGTCSPEESVETILRRMDDYIHYIVPQFGLTDINIQRMPLVDTSDPFIARDVPLADEWKWTDPDMLPSAGNERLCGHAAASRSNTSIVIAGAVRKLIPRSLLRPSETCIACSVSGRSRMTT